MLNSFLFFRFSLCTFCVLYTHEPTIVVPGLHNTTGRRWFLGLERRFCQSNAK